MSTDSEGLSQAETGMFEAGRQSRDSEISDLKQQLGFLEDGCRKLEAQSDSLEDQLREERAHADALAGCLDFFWRWAGDKAPEGWLKQAQAILTEHRQSREKGNE